MLAIKEISIIIATICVIGCAHGSEGSKAKFAADNIVVVGELVKVGEGRTGICSILDEEYELKVNVKKAKNLLSKSAQISITKCVHGGFPPYSDLNETIAEKKNKLWFFIIKSTENGYLEKYGGKVLELKDKRLAVCPWNIEYLLKEFSLPLVDLSYKNFYVRDLSKISSVEKELYQNHACFIVVNNKAIRTKGVLIGDLIR